MSTWPRELLLGVALATSACAIPYPVLHAAGPFVIPPSPSSDPLGAGARVTLVTTAPPGCRSLGLATGVGGIADQYQPYSNAQYAEWRAQALVALRNAVGEAGGTHTRVDAEVRFTKQGVLTHVLVRGDALACGG
jgi:hypothetical protein